MARLVPDTINKCVKEGQSDLDQVKIIKFINKLVGSTINRFNCSNLKNCPRESHSSFRTTIISSPAKLFERFLGTFSETCKHKDGRTQLKQHTFSPWHLVSGLRECSSSCELPSCQGLFPAGACLACWPM